MPRSKKVILLGCIGMKKFIFGVAMAGYDAIATPNMNFYHLKSVLQPNARPKIKVNRSLKWEETVCKKQSTATSGGASCYEFPRVMFGMVSI